MAPATFHNLLTDPTRLMAVEEADLLGLIDRYPYSTGARVLLALHAELTGHPEAEGYYERAAASTFDRAHLYDYLRSTLERAQHDPPLEESLELLSLEELEKPELLVNNYQSAAQENSIQASLPPSPAPEHAASPPDSAPPLPDTAPAPAPDTPADAPDEPNPSPVPLPPPIVPQEHLTPTTPEPLEHFLKKQTITTREELRERLAGIRRRQAEAQGAKGRDVKKFARRSLVASDGMISATLAEVFIRQGQYQHAIRIYEQLALANPEKRPIFAALIKDLKRKL